MAYHMSNLGKFASIVSPWADAEGYVPEAGDRGHPSDWVKGATAATERAKALIDAWRAKDAGPLRR